MEFTDLDIEISLKIIKKKILRFFYMDLINSNRRKKDLVDLVKKKI